MNTHYITWWNVENLFDERDAPESRRPADLKRKIKADLKDWTPDVLDRKLMNLASVLDQVNEGAGPDILGVCEVENAHVLEALIAKLSNGRNYKVIHHDMSDNRGIDVAFIYDSAKYEFDEGTFFHHPVIKRYATRELVQATLKCRATGTELILVGNHWPSRSAGTYDSEPYRILTAETLSYFIQRIQEIKGKDAAVIVMGDFNDEPQSRSLMDYALGDMSPTKVTYATSPKLLNMMWELLAEGKGSYYYSGETLMLDQFLVSKGIVKKSGLFDLEASEVKLEIFDGMVKGRYDAPIRFGQKAPNLNGFSDHLPISLRLVER